jgi:RNA polymerase sigma-70 factor (ECF subfamily)
VEKVDRFETNRPRLLGLAYRLLGEAFEAEDVVQDAYLRWRGSRDVDVPEAWLTKVVTNLCLNRLASARARRERYVGPWMPEPVFTDGGVLGPLETVEQRDSLSVGMLVILERLTPPERAAFVLREAFGHSHAEIAEILEIGEAHARQLYRRAREHVGAERRRFTATPAQSRRMLERFLAASLDGDVTGLERLLAEDVVAWADGGGEVAAARRPVVGAARVLRYLLGIGAHPRAAASETGIRMVNGEPALVIREAGELSMIAVLETANDRITTVRIMVNPHKLAFAAAQPR